MRKNLIITIAAICLISLYAYAESTKIKNTAAGYQLGTTSTQAIGFYGAAPVTQKFVTVSSDSTTLTNLINELVRMGIVKTN